MNNSSSINWDKSGIDISKVRGGKGFCPKCHDTRKNKADRSLSVDIQTGLWNCHNCGHKGIAMEHLTPKKEFVKPPARLEKLGKKAIEWFESRGISNNTLLRLKVTESSEFMPGLDQQGTVICFNYYREEDLINIKFRGPKKTFKMAKDAELIFYNLNSAVGEDSVVIVEGEIDCLTLHECGIYNAVSVPNGASKGQKLEYLDNCWQYFENIEKVIIAVDDDEAGRSLKEELARRLGKEKCFSVEYPEGCKDANEVLCKYGKEAVKELVANATEWPLEGIVTMNEMIEDLYDWYENGYPKGAATKIPGFDDLLTFAPGQLTMITGMPGHGKDEFANYIMTSLAKHEKWKWGVCGFEESALITTTKLMEKFVERSFAHRINPQDRMSKSEFERSILMVDESFYFIKMEIINASMEGILTMAKELVKRKGIKGLIINPWNCLEHKIPAGYSETQYTSEELTRLINFLNKYGLHGFLIAHPTKMQRDKKTNRYEVPTLYTISGSANFYNKTHNGICVYRDLETNRTEVYVQKVKWSWLGQTGWSSYDYNTYTRQYSFIESSIKPKSPRPVSTLSEPAITSNPNQFTEKGQPALFIDDELEGQEPF